MGGEGIFFFFKISNYISLMHIETSFCMCKNKKGTKSFGKVKGRSFDGWMVGIFFL